MTNPLTSEQLTELRALSERTYKMLTAFVEGNGGWNSELVIEHSQKLHDAEPALLALASQSLDREAEIVRLEDELNRQKAKTEYEAERAGNFENDLDEAKAREAEVRSEARAAAFKQFDALVCYYPTSDIALVHSNQAVVSNVCCNILEQVRALTQQPAKEPI